MRYAEVSSEGACLGSVHVETSLPRSQNPLSVVLAESVGKAYPVHSVPAGRQELPVDGLPGCLTVLKTGISVAVYSLSFFTSLVARPPARQWG